MPTGTIGATVALFLSSDKVKRVSPGTQQSWRRSLNDIREKYGEGDIETLRPRHIKMDLSSFAPHPANNRLKAWRALCKWACDQGLIETDPARDVRKRDTPKTDGHTPWTRDDFTRFRNHWPEGTPQRAALEVLYQSCAAIVDAVRLGPSMVQGGWLTYQRRKSKSLATAPWTAPAPEWFEPAPYLPQTAPTFIMTAYGKPRGHKGAASWFSRACTDAGLPHLSSHGVRKGRAAMFRENGASREQRMAILGHETESEASRYGKSADLRRVVEG